MGAQNVKLSFMDRAIMAISPSAGLRRIQCKAAANYLTASGFISSKSNKNSMKGWYPNSGEADEDTLPTLPDIRESSRDLYMNAPMATDTIRRVKTNAVGYGLQFRASIDRGKLGISKEEAHEWEENTEREFRVWSESKHCDLTMNQNFYDMQDLILCSILLNRDLLILTPQIKRAGSVYDTRIQLIEADRISNPDLQPDSHKVAGGIELDKYGTPKAYYIKTSKAYPYDQDMKWKRIPAFGARSGRPNALHVYFKERVGQRRGVPLLAPVIETLKQLTRLAESELNAAVLASFFTVFVKTMPGGAGGLQGGFIPGQEIEDGPEGEFTYEMGQGNVIEMDAGQDISIADPKRPNIAFEPFFNALIKQLGSSLEIPYEQLILHFSASYSASRAALLEAWKYYRKVRTWMVRNICQPIYEIWLEEAIQKGRVKAPGFYIDPAIRYAWCRSIWGGPGQGQIDPYKETRASELKIKNYLATHEDEYVAINGGNWDDALHRLSRERDSIIDNKFPYPSSDSNMQNIDPDLRNTNENGDKDE